MCSRIVCCIHQFLIDQVNSTYDNDVVLYGYVVVDDDIQLDELDALKADLLSLQASVHKLACQLVFHLTLKILFL